MTTTPSSEPLAPAYARAFNLPELPTWRPYTNGAKPAPELPALWGISGGYVTPPAIGARVVVTMNGFGPATVTGYCVQDGFVGVHVRPDIRPAWHARQNPDRHVIVVFGAEIKPEPTPEAGRIWRRAHDDARGWRQRRGNAAEVTDRIITNHFGLSRDGGHLGPIAEGSLSDVRDLYTRGFKVAAFVS